MGDEPPQAPPAELTSWKEIAAYLGVSLRTAQKWEKERGLPIRRLPGGRGRVGITVADLEGWKASGTNTEPAPAAPAAPTRSRGWKLATTAAACLVVTAGAWFAFAVRSADPATWRIEHDVLIVSDARGRELWRKLFPGPPALTGEPGQQPWIGDLDEDGRAEVIFNYVPLQIAPSALICYSHDGREKWRFAPGRTVETRIERFEPPYRTARFAVARSGGRQVVFVTSMHFLYYPCQVAALSAQGKLLGEYWHSGQLRPIAVGPDGLLYLGGVSNGHKEATLVVLDPAALSGASVEQDADYQLLGLPAARERARMLFARTCINRKQEQWNWATEFFFTAEGLAVSVMEVAKPRGADVYYHLTRSLRLQRVVPSSQFEAVHAELHEKRVLDHPLSADELGDWKRLTYLVDPNGARQQ